jgi:exonuclease SbcD
MTVRILHFADAHIDMANYGRFDPESLLPVRVTDFLRSLDTIIETAIEEQVDMVLFAGDAYKDRNPHPTFQREWGRRVMRLSQAGISTLLLVGNHDVSPAAGRAHTITEFNTLQVPHVTVGDRIKLYGPAELNVPLQILTIPWVPRSVLMTRGEMSGKSLEEIYLILEEAVSARVNGQLDQADPSLPTILVAHASVTGARYGSERLVMLGNELVLAQSLVRDPRFDYVALGHIHRHQDLNPDAHPPVVYAGSIERIDFGEAKETKGFILARVGKGETQWEFVPLETRSFLDIKAIPRSAETATQDILDQIPAPEQLADAIVRLQISYPADWESQIDDAAIQNALSPAMESKTVKNRQTETRSRLGDAAAVETLTPPELLELYWKTLNMDSSDSARLQSLGTEIIRAVDESQSVSLE